FTRKRGETAYACTIASREICGAEKEGRIWEVQQSCTAQFNGLDLAIISKVEKIVRGPTGVTDFGYSPDDFFVRPESDGLMRGHFTSLNQAPVRFWRTEDLVS